MTLGKGTWEAQSQELPSSRLSQQTLTPRTRVSQAGDESTPGGATASPSSQELPASQQAEVPVAGTPRTLSVAREQRAPEPDRLPGVLDRMVEFAEETRELIIEDT